MRRKFTNTSESGASLLATVVIATRNRREELMGAISSAVEQSIQPEVLIMDDASTDGTTEMVRTEFPLVRIERSERALGYIAQRNRGALLARGRLVFSLDDDAVYATRTVVEEEGSGFDEPRVGAVAIPFVESRKPGREYQRAPSRGGVWVTDSFVGTAHAIRRDLFLELGGYREHFVHQGEERDLSIRLLAAGFVVRLGSSEGICHRESPKREFSRMDFYGRRNDVLFACHNVPWPCLPLHLTGTLLNGLKTAFRVGRYRNMLRGMARGCMDCWAFRDDRRPVSARVYSLHSRLRRTGPLKFAEVNRLLPTLVEN